MKVTGMDSETKRWLDTQLRDLKFRAQDVHDLFNTHRNKIMDEIIPSDDDEFNTMEKFTLNYMPMILEHIKLPKRVDFQTPFSEKNFITECLKCLTDLEQAACHLREIEKGSCYTTAQKEILEKIDGIKLSCQMTKKVLLHRASDLNIPSLDYAPSVELPEDHFDRNAYYVAVVYHAKSQTEIIHSTSQNL